MKELAHKLAEIEAKVNQLIVENNRLGQLNAELVAQNKDLNSRLEAGGNQATSPGFTAAGAVPEAMVKKENNKNTKQLIKQIDQYTKEIDKCIEWLNNN